MSKNQTFLAFEIITVQEFLHTIMEISWKKTIFWVSLQLAIIGDLTSGLMLIYLILIEFEMFHGSRYNRLTLLFRSRRFDPLLLQYFRLS